jgi:hypothetical protein
MRNCRTLQATSATTTYLIQTQMLHTWLAGNSSYFDVVTAHGRDSS